MLSLQTPTTASPFVHGEAARLYDLMSLNVLDAPRIPVADAVVDVAAALFETPMAFVSLLDGERQWIKAACGLTIDSTSQSVSFCAYTIREPRTMIVEDARLDSRFAENPLVTGEPHLRFYAGTPLITSNRHCVGTLCVADTQPRRFGPEQVALLEKLARVVVASLEERRTGGPSQR